uniref:Collagen, type XII, alpha 1b n=1 Tax=Maylandia zebra TaxID=106582 RepID=A0A3P9D5L8_9CICH
SVYKEQVMSVYLSDTFKNRKSSKQVTWTPALGKLLNYRLKYVPHNGGKEVVQKIPAKATCTIMKNLKPATTYNITVLPIYKRSEGKAKQGVGTTRIVGVVSSLVLDTQCKTTAKADIMLLVDGSWSIGRKNFKTIRNFIARLVSVFDIGPDRVQIGLAQYSGDPKTEWHLNTHHTKESLLNAVANLPYKGGNTMTGMALNHILQYNFKPNVGLRPDSHKISILITDGKSQDEVIVISQNLRDSGIELYAIGVKNADEYELRSIASDPDDIHMYNVYDFQFLVDITDELSVNLCNSVKGSGREGAISAPTNLVTSEVTQSSFRATWTPPNGTVEKYDVTYMMTAGEHGGTVFNGSVSTVVLENLNPLTEYVISVYAVVGKQSSEPLRGTETTRECFLFCFSAAGCMDIPPPAGEVVVGGDRPPNLGGPEVSPERWRLIPNLTYRHRHTGTHRHKHPFPPSCSHMHSLHTQPTWRQT